jgi:hypothetical protein
MHEARLFRMYIPKVLDGLNIATRILKTTSLDLQYPSLRADRHRNNRSPRGCDAGGAGVLEEL